MNIEGDSLSKRDENNNPRTLKGMFTDKERTSLQLEDYLERQKSGQAQTTWFSQDLLSKPVVLRNHKALDVDERQQIASIYHNCGMVILDLRLENPSPQDLKCVADQLRLGEAFTPPYLKDFDPNLVTTDNINIIGLSPKNLTTTCTGALVHNAFCTSEEQPVHCDGTTQEIGLIKTSIVLCAEPAVSGGLSTFFNASEAFRRLAIESPELALSMLDSRALCRTHLHDSKNPYTGPVFALRDGELYSRFSLDKTSNWETGFQVVPNLSIAFDRMISWIQPDSDLFLALRLERGHAVLIANDKISHGRTHYTSGERERQMFRGLYLKTPQPQ